MIEMYNDIECEHLLDFSWEEINTDISYSFDDFCKVLSISHSKLLELIKSERIQTISDPIRQTEVFARSWIKPIKLFLKTEHSEDMNNSWRPGSFSIRGWSNEEMLPRLKQLFDFYEINIERPNVKTIWEIYKKFLKEEIVNPQGGCSAEYVYASADKDKYILRLKRQIETFFTESATGDLLHHLSFLQLNLELELELNAALNLVNVSQGFDWLVDEKKYQEFISNIESIQGFEELMKAKPISFKIKIEPQ